MSVSWTEEQQQVIHLRNRNILVSAAAGSGKTAVLVERIKERVLDEQHPIDIDKLLVVTFTNAAAAQMKERVAKALETEQQKNPKNMRLVQQCALVQSAQITTIDSFCLHVIRNHFHEINLEPNFRIAEEGELKLLREDVLTKQMEASYEQKDETFLRLIDSYAAARSDAAVKEMILQLYQYAQSYPWPKQWFARIKEDYEISDAAKLEESELMHTAVIYAKEVLASLQKKAEHYLTVTQEADGPYMYEAACEQDADMLERFAEADSYEKLRLALTECRFSVLGRTKEYTGSAEKQDYVKAERKQVKDILSKLTADIFVLETEDILKQLRRMSPVVTALATITEQFAEAYAEQKRAKNLVDFDDLEHFALQILVDGETNTATAAAVEFRRAYEEIMIDEYQDSNYVQETILKAISREESGENNLFMVGDVKQSIYRFRLARPELFMEKYDTYPMTDGDRQRIDLHKNFRSRPEVLSFTNEVFSRIMKRDIGGVLYDGKAALYPAASFEAAADEKHFISELLIAEESEEEMKESGITRAQLEAKMVAERIHRLMKQQLVTDEGSKALRPIRYGDIVILLRSLSDWADTFAGVLNASGIPAHTVSKTGYFSAIEIQTVLNYLRILDNPRQDIPLTAILKSPIVGMSDEQLARIRILNREGSFYDCVQMAAETEEQLADFMAVYEKLRGQIFDLPIHELLLCVLEETGYGDYAAAMPAGRQRMANIHMLIEKAIEYEKSSYRGLFHFIRYIDELQRYHVDFGEADLIGENDNSVNIMSIHKSKGLEFPVCFVSGLGKAFNKQDSRSRMILHPTLGIGLDEINLTRRLKLASFRKKVIARQTELENLGEELRVLYVAMTRAKEKLIMTGTAKDCAAQLEQLSYEEEDAEGMEFTDRTMAKSFLSLLLPVAVHHKEKVQLLTVPLESMVTEEVGNQLAAGETLSQRVRLAEQQENEEELLSSLSKQYDYPMAVDLLTKYSVSELKHRAMRRKAEEEDLDTMPVFLSEQVTPYIPPFMEGKLLENQGALRGTAVHRLLECFDFSCISREESDIIREIKKQLAELVEEGRVSADMEALIQIPQIAGFMQSELAQRMKCAAQNGNLFREKPFVMGRQEEEMILIQGIIDVFWIEEDGIVLLDYKTDRVDSEKQLVSMYTEQLNLYQEALERIFDIKVKEKYLYSFRLHKPVRI